MDNAKLAATAVRLDEALADLERGLRLKAEAEANYREARLRLDEAEAVCHELQTRYDTAYESYFTGE